MKLSIITAVGPLKHYEKFIPRYIDNVMAQTVFSECEIIVVYMEWDEKFTQLNKLNNVKYILDDQEKGAYNAWNMGIQASNAPYVTNWNIDDIRHPTSLERQATILDNNSDIDLIYNYHMITNDWEETFKNLNPHTERHVKFYPDDGHAVVHQCCMCGPDPLWRRALHDKVGYFDYENYPSIADWDMWIRMADAGCKFKLIPLPLCLFYDGDSSISQRFQSSREEIENKKLYQQHKEGFDNVSPVKWSIGRVYINEKSY